MAGHVEYLRDGKDWFICEWIMMIKLAVAAMILVLYAIKFNIPYGRYNKTSVNLCNIYINAKISWFIQELPSVIIPLYLLLNVGGDQAGDFNPNIILLCMFILHYIQRTFIYSLCIRTNKSSPLTVVLSAFMFCSMNGYLQGRSLIQFYHYDISWLWSFPFIIGQVLFLTGMAINLFSDAILRGLRQDGDTSYKIPRGGLFEYVSGANFFGETVEWVGFAIACWSLPAMVFAIFTTCMIGTRALSHHRFYLEKFEDYPKDRKAFIPFLI